MPSTPLAKAALVCIVASIGVAHAQNAGPNALPEVKARVKLTVGADGIPSDVKVTGATPDIGALIYKRAQQWKFVPAQWQGKAVNAPFDRWLDLQVLSNPSGGFAMRMAGFSDAMFDAMEQPPKPSEDALPSFTSNVTFAYVVNLGADGRVKSVVQVLPVPLTATQQARSYAPKVQSRLSGWQGNPRRVDGVAIACSRLYVEQHGSSLMGRKAEGDFAGWAEYANPEKLPATDAKAIQAELAKLDAAGTRCPAPILETKIAGEML